MKFFERTAKFFGRVSVKEQGNQVRVTGVDGLIMRKYFKTLFETDQINKVMFSSITDTSFSLNKFFLPDLVYMLTVFRHSDYATWSGKRTVDRIVAGIMKDTWYKMSALPVEPIVDKTRLNLLKWKPLPHQVEFLDLFGDKMPRYDLRGMVLAMAPGTGKEQSLDAKILTDKGWITMGEVTLETKVMTPYHTYASVLGIYPQGVKDIYRLVLEDGRNTECGLEHLWRVYHHRTHDDWNILTLKDMLSAENDLFIPVMNRSGDLTYRKRVISITKIGQKEAQCISIDHPDHLYITDDYIVTHNTFTDLMVATCVIPPSVAEIKIVISPKKALHLVWEKSIKTVFKKVPTCWVSDQGGKMPLSGVEYYVFNFEQLDQAIELGKTLVAAGKRYFVIIDESHNFADFKSNRTQKLVKLLNVKDNIYSIWTSGSPILKMGSELISFLKCSDPRFDSDAEMRFKKIWSAAPGRANEIFNHRLGRMMAFIVGKSVVSDTKPTVKELPVRLPPALAHRFLMTSVREEMREFIKDRLVFYQNNIKEYRRIVARWLDYHETTLKTRAERSQYYVYQKNLKMIMRAPDLMMIETLSAARTYERTKLIPSLPPTERRTFRNALSAVKNIKLKVRGEALGTVLSKRRSECAAALGIYCRPDVIMKESLSKTLFFASSVQPVLTLEKYLKNLGFEPMLVYAGTNSNLTANIEAFTTDPNINPICATMQSLSEAVPVIAASTVVLLNRPFRQATWDQVIARADRLGQIHPVTVIEVTLDTGSEPNVSSSTDVILANIRELINEIVGPDFAGPDPDDREYKQVIDASKEDPDQLYELEKLGL